MIDKVEIAAKNWADNDIDSANLIKWAKSIYKKGFKRGVERCREIKGFTAEEVCSILIDYGQHDKKFRLGEKIKYSPSEVENILKKVEEKE